VIFGGAATDYACSTSSSTVTNDNYTSIWGVAGCQIAAENFKLNANYDCGSTNCSQSAYVDDNCIGSAGTNFCWALETCGDGNVGGGEQCDDGSIANGDCCDASCQYESSGTLPLRRGPVHCQHL
jgi:cysteine-rich repeat protein